MVLPRSGGLSQVYVPPGSKVNSSRGVLPQGIPAVGIRATSPPQNARSGGLSQVYAPPGASQMDRRRPESSLGDSETLREPLSCPARGHPRSGRRCWLRAAAAPRRRAVRAGAAGLGRLRPGLRRAGEAGEAEAVLETWPLPGAPLLLAAFKAEVPAGGRGGCSSALWMKWQRGP
ncbi:hypothetical protein NDU88_003028 [Pleurodeles waltl]|uniref:Uncharacterized protein n=1 Tax=Pleurodeles waltl TaxID=8319 RepID=A0AAV7T3L4_PLEWA|nr:hypothetical protein NDU88_003028 [Pleurodeles waltl]